MITLFVPNTWGAKTINELRKMLLRVGMVAFVDYEFAPEDIDGWPRQWVRAWIKLRDAARANPRAYK